MQELAFAPGTRNLLQVEWDGENIGYELMDINVKVQYDTEDVSYVASAYVPQCLRHGGRPTLSNAHVRMNVVLVNRIYVMN